jgi:uncharacterized membrane protein
VSEPVKVEAQVQDQRIEHFVGNLLRVGVLVAAGVGLLGGILFLAQHGGDPTDYRRFHGEPTSLTTFRGIVAGVRSLDGRAVVQLGALLLIATPVARVALTAFAFVLRRDWLYVAVSTCVLAVLLYSLAVS